MKTWMVCYEVGLRANQKASVEAETHDKACEIAKEYWSGRGEIAGQFKWCVELHSNSLAARAAIKESAI